MKTAASSSNVVRLKAEPGKSNAKRAKSNPDDKALILLIRTATATTLRQWAASSTGGPTWGAARIIETPG
jgi:hypothetical protein